ncbi:helix-turn-helix domain-containing protein [Cyclobacterium plantarum]|uniref:Transcriptional regulator n=1 Tax=Cyclobacterium plantarum TaxID=2716263 RepID=A0ABX0HG07_9BACT|nr:transcriptional regulator [Cyclobacterium plantarum]NHE59238.1 transcriptional regulator [Cyclobacterium plantarum]
MNWNKPITTEQEYKMSLARLAEIFEADAGSGEGMEAELLVTLIDKYEREHYPVSLPEPIDAIKETMERKRLMDKDLIPYIGSKTTVSLVLNRKRALTIEMIRNLSSFLGLPVEVLIQPYELAAKNTSVVEGKPDCSD